jgi:competence protein ComEC
VRALFAIKHAILAQMNRIIPEPESSLAGGITLGAKASLGERELDLFRIAGIVHVVVLSGYNITIVADSIMRVMSFLPRMFSLAMGSLGVLFFAVMTGGGATVVRASIMAFLVVVARATGRTHDAGRMLIIAAALMILWNPYIVLFDPSFQLSFIATLGLIYLAPIVERKCSRIPERFGLRSIAASTLAAQIAVLPLLLYQSGIFSTVALPVNMLALPLVPLAMLTSFLAAMFGFLGWIFAMPFGFVAYLLLAYMFGVVHFFAAIPLASFVVPAFPLWVVGVSYVLLIALTMRVYRVSPPVLRIAIGT